MLSHELRNPLGAIVTATAPPQDARPPTPTAAQRFIGDRSSGSPRQMARLLDDLLEASRVTQNKIELRKELVDLRGVSREAADAVRDADGSRAGWRFTVDMRRRAASWSTAIRRACSRSR